MYFNAHTVSKRMVEELAKALLSYVFPCGLVNLSQFLSYFYLLKCKEMSVPYHHINLLKLAIRLSQKDCSCEVRAVAFPQKPHVYENWLTVFYSLLRGLVVRYSRTLTTRHYGRKALTTCPCFEKLPHKPRPYLKLSHSFS